MKFEPHIYHRMHEQREHPASFLTLVLPNLDGRFIESLDWDPKTEHVRIFERDRIASHYWIDSKDAYYLVLKTEILDVAGEEARKKELADRIVEKHFDALETSFIKCFIDLNEDNDRNVVKKFEEVLKNGNKKGPV
jgi:hypothetical protein